MGWFNRKPAQASATDAQAPDSSVSDVPEVTADPSAVPSDSADPTVVEGAREPAMVDVPVADDAAHDEPRPRRFAALRAKLGTRGTDKARFSAVPVRVIIGYLPEVTERDALEYAVGIAEKHFEQIGMSFFDAFKYSNGYAFEAHEGGEGKAFLPEIIRYFEAQGPYRTGEEVTAVIRTATRAVEVQRTRDGLVAIILPEGAGAIQSDWLEPTSKMQPAINKRTGFLVAGAALFTTGFIAMMVASILTRYQPYEPPPEQKTEFINMATTPLGQWPQLEAISPNSYVKVLRYRNGRWEMPEIVSEAPAAAGEASASPGAATPGLPLPPPLPPSGPVSVPPAPVSAGAPLQGAAR